MFQSATFTVGAAVGKTGGGYGFRDKTAEFDNFLSDIEEVLGEPIRPEFEKGGTRKAGWHFTPNATILFSSELDRSNTSRPGTYRSRLLVTDDCHHARWSIYVPIAINAVLGDDIDQLVSVSSDAATQLPSGIPAGPPTITYAPDSELLAQRLHSLLHASVADFSCDRESLLGEIDSLVAFLPEKVLNDTFLSLESHPDAQRVVGVLSVNGFFETKRCDLDTSAIVEVLDGLLASEENKLALGHARSMIDDLDQFGGLLAWLHMQFGGPATSCGIRFAAEHDNIVGFMGHLERKSRGSDLVLTRRDRSDTALLNEHDRQVYAAELGTMLAEHIERGFSGVDVLLEAHARGLGWRVVREAHLSLASQPSALQSWFISVVHISRDSHGVYQLLWLDHVDVHAVVRDCDGANGLLVASVLLSRARGLANLERRLLADIDQRVAGRALRLIASGIILDESMIVAATHEYVVATNDTFLLEKLWSDKIVGYDQCCAAVAGVANSQFSGSWSRFVDRFGDQYMLAMGVPTEVAAELRGRRGRPRLGRSLRRNKDG